MANSKSTVELEKCQNLGLRESLSLSYRYPMACRELGVILRLAYSKSPKTLQSLLFEDTLFAFRLLPQMQTQSAVSAANLLIQSAEAALPKQKRGLAATEFKQSKVAYKRRAKTQQFDKGRGMQQQMTTAFGSSIITPILVTLKIICFKVMLKTSNVLLQIVFAKMLIMTGKMLSEEHTQIVKYILGDISWWGISPSDSDSDSDEELGLKFWTYIRH